MFRLLLLPELGHNAAYPKTTKCGVRTQQMFAKGIFNTKKSYHFTKNTIIYSHIHRSSCKIHDPFPEYLKESILLFPLWCSSLFLHRLNEDICLTIFSLSNYTTNSPIFLVLCKKKKGNPKYVRNPYTLSCPQPNYKKNDGCWMVLQVS